jgi:hypothetical protein
MYILAKPMQVKRPGTDQARNPQKFSSVLGKTYKRVELLEHYYLII